MKKLFIAFLLLFNSLISFGYKCEGNLGMDVTKLYVISNVISTEVHKDNPNYNIIDNYIYQSDELLSHIMTAHYSELTPEMKDTFLELEQNFKTLQNICKYINK